MSHIIIQGQDTTITVTETEPLGQVARDLVRLVNTAVLLHVFKVNGKYSNGALPHGQDETLNDQEIVSAIRNEIANALPTGFTLDELIVKVYERSGFKPKGHTSRFSEVTVRVRTTLIALEWTSKTLLGTVEDSFIDVLCGI